MPVRAGIDLVSVDAVRASLDTHGERYLRRVFTEREIADCGGAQEAAPERLAARFAAKEAAMKALRVGPDDALPWHDVEVRRDPDGWVELALAGRAAELAAAAGVTDVAVSLAHENGVATAIVVVEMSRSDR